MKNDESISRIETDVPQLTTKKELFCHEFLVDFNATQAAIRSKFSKKTAYSQGQRLLKDVEVQKYLAKISKAHLKAIDVRAIDVLKEAARVAFSDVGQAFDEDNCLKPIDQMPEEIRRVISSIEVDEIWEFEGEGDNRKKVKKGETKKVRFWNKDRQIEHLMRHLNLFAADNKRQVSITNLADIAAIMGKNDKTKQK